MRKVTIAATQMSCTNQIDENIEKAETLIRQAASQGANIILLQELFSWLYFCQVIDHDYLNLAREEEDNPMLEHFQKISKELHVVLPLSFFEKAGETFFNSVVVFDADGTKLGKYRKIHIPDDIGYYEKWYFAPGDLGFKVFDTEFCRLGVGICWDQWFPEAARAMYLMGAEVLMYLTAIGTFAVNPADLPKEPFNDIHWRNTMLGHAAANIAPVVASNRVGVERLGNTAMKFHGSSFIGNHDGSLIAQMDKESEGVLLHTVDLDEVFEKRRREPFRRDRRTEHYAILMTMDGTFKI